MRIMAITKQDTWAAADALEASGLPATLAAVRERLGGGSFSTIQPFMSEWREQNTRKATTIVPMPADLQERVKQLGDHVWAAASASADRQLHIEREALCSARDAFEADRAELAVAADNAAVDLEASQRRIEGLEAALAARGAELEDLRTRLAVAAAKASDAEHLIDQERRERQAAVEALAQARETIGRLEGQLSKRP